MPNTITADDLDKAARNLERLAHFLAQRRGWILATDAEAPAISVRNAAGSLAALLQESFGDALTASGSGTRPPQLEPSSTVSSSRLSKFADFIDQLHEWFAARAGCELPADGADALGVIHRSLGMAERSITELMAPPGSQDTGSQPLISSDLGPVVEVDMRAQLVLEDTSEMPLLQVFQGVTELTPEALEQVDAFLNKQGIELEDREHRKLHEKVLRWVQATPESQVLVIKLSGLSGRAEVFSSYRPKQKAQRGGAS